ncbi:hypothetical protein PUN28_002718 [Cardiocondyla obscurior]|uniref:Uncharacterized protein n=1 Tax=Cardiocondyla obscurior TaxID=286306 RepID=A0AAW2GVY4_9HYME
MPASSILPIKCNDPFVITTRVRASWTPPARSSRERLIILISSSMRYRNNYDSDPCIAFDRLVSCIRAIRHSEFFMRRIRELRFYFISFLSLSLSHTFFFFFFFI